MKLGVEEGAGALDVDGEILAAPERPLVADNEGQVPARAGVEAVEEGLPLGTRLRHRRRDHRQG